MPGKDVGHLLAVQAHDIGNDPPAGAAELTSGLLCCEAPAASQHRQPWWLGDAVVVEAWLVVARWLWWP